MSSSQRCTPPLDHDSNARKRVCKACDRCRLKKSKCDGTTPCSRCRSDNAICVFGERKKSHDKVYPKGYVEMLEQQQIQLVNGLHELYQRAKSGQDWDGPPLSGGGNGRPLTHDILDSLGVLQYENINGCSNFEDDLDIMQHRLIRDGSDSGRRRGSSDSDTERSSVRTSFFEATPQHSFAKGTFTTSQLPTPPLTQSPFTMPIWHGVPGSKASQVRPQSLEVHPGCPAGQASMSTIAIDQQSWLDPPMAYDEDVEFMRFDSLSNYDSYAGLRQQIPAPMESTIQTATLPNWSEEDFTTFLDSTIN